VNTSTAGRTATTPCPAPIVPLELAAGPVPLRPWEDDDLEDIWAALQDAQIRLWNGTGSASREDAARMLHGRQDWSSGDHASWAIADSETGALLGSLSLHRIDREQGTAEIGYWTTPAARGRGAATHAVDTACRWAFAQLGLTRIELCHAVENTASARVAEKAGFVLEGRSRRSYRYGDGIRHDEIHWARLSDDPPPRMRPAGDGGPNGR
jgi:RimJ/RimL family protein N-acetyltransferase